MQRDVHDPSYDPGHFVQDFSDDEQLQLALKAATELSNSIAPLLPGESAIDAGRRIDQAFHHLRVETDNNLDQFHKGERQGHKNQFMAEAEAEIRARHQSGIDKTRAYDAKIGGQFAQEEEIQRFRKNINNNPELKQVLLDLSNRQAVQSEAISHAIRYTPPGLNRQEQKAEPADQRSAEQPVPPDAPKHATPKYKPFKGESETQFAERQQRMEARDQREQQREKDQPDLKIHHRQSGPTFGR